MGRFNHSNHFSPSRHNDFLNLFVHQLEIIEESFVNCEDPILFKPDILLEISNWKALSGNFILQKLMVGMSQLCRLSLGGSFVNDDSIFAYSDKVTEDNHKIFMLAGIWE